MWGDDVETGTYQQRGGGATRAPAGSGPARTPPGTYGSTGKSAASVGASAASGASAGAAGGAGSGVSLDQLSQQIQRFQSKVVQLENLSAHVGTPKDGRQLRQRLQNERTATQTLAKDIKGGIQNFQCTPSEKMQFDKVCAQFNTVLRKFETVNRNTVRKEREALAALSQSVKESETAGGSAASPPQAARGGRGPQPAVSEVSDDMEAQQMRMGGGNRSTVMVEKEIIDEQNAELMKLEEDLNQLSGMYVDMAALVNEQQKDLDVIETKVAQSAGNIDKGIDEVKKARDYQKKTRKKMCILIIIILAVACAITFYFVFGNKKN